MNETEQICDRYKQLYGGVIYDVLEHLGYPDQVLSHSFMPLKDEIKLAGPAFTVKGTPSCEKNTEVRYRRLKMIREMTRPCIEVRDGGTPYPVAIYGELSATSAAAHGAVGAIINGGTRDCSFLNAMQFPVFTRYRTPIEAFGRWQLLEYQVPVRLDGETTADVIVNPGDFIFGDFDGLLVIPKDLAMPVLTECERIVGIENEARLEFARGEDPVAVFEKHKRL
ncbi:MAG: RraA family protein [Acidobacteriaceae bacterium]|nr:RraA family protein [Acidobacteriaceae bacterium]